MVDNPFDPLDPDANQAALDVTGPGEADLPTKGGPPLSRQEYEQRLRQLGLLRAAQSAREAAKFQDFRPAPLEDRRVFDQPGPGRFFDPTPIEQALQEKSYLKPQTYRAVDAPFDPQMLNNPLSRELGLGRITSGRLHVKKKER